MDLSEINYKKLYKVQDILFRLLNNHYSDLYLTGGTALGRFYLEHRYSDDLDFFINSSVNFNERIKAFFQLISTVWKIDETRTVISENFARFILKSDPSLKVEFVNDVAARWGETLYSESIPLDNAANILANKLTALVSRDEPKDVFDIVKLAEKYSFNWAKVYAKAFDKQIMNETDVAMRLSTFPVAWIETVKWLAKPFNKEDFTKKLRIVANDFLLARDNSLGAGKTPITGAIPIGY